MDDSMNVAVENRREALTATRWSRSFHIKKIKYNTLYAYTGWKSGAGKRDWWHFAVFTYNIYL